MTTRGDEATDSLDRSIVDPHLPIHCGRSYCVWFVCVFQ